MHQLDAMRIFVRVTQTGSFTQAADSLGLPRASVSNAIKQLEAKLGTRLLHRTTRRVQLTQDGQACLERCQDLLADMEEWETMFVARDEALTGRLRVDLPATLARTTVIPQLPAFLAQHPALRLELSSTDRRVDLVRDGFDLAIRGSDQLEDSSLVARRLADMPHVLCAAPAYLQARGAPSSPAALKAHECVRFSLSGHADVWTFRKGARVERVTVQSRYSVSSSLAVCDALRAGFGLSLVPRPYVERDLRAGRLQVVLDDWRPVTTTLYAVYPSRRHLSPKIRVFLDFLAKTFDTTMV